MNDIIKIKIYFKFLQFSSLFLILFQLLNYKMYRTTNFSLI